MTAIPVNRPAPKRARLDIPKIKLISWAGLESVGWVVVISHLVKWAVSFAYFATFQVRYAVGYQDSLWTVWYLKTRWDDLPHWLGLTPDHPVWWITWRHDIRDVTIAVVATIITLFLFAKPKYPADDNPGVRVYLTSVPLGIVAALVPISLVGVLAWKLPWLLRHGWQVPAKYGALASEVNGWVAAGTWITILMGVTGGVVAKMFIQRVADDVQWFWAERSAAKIRSESALSLSGRHVIGTPAHRKRVRWLLVNKPDLPQRSKWLVWALLIIGFFGLAYSIAGAWLNLVGPAAPH